MGYRRALLRRWSRRDRLAVLVVAVTVAFLTGTTVLLLAAGAQTTAIAAQFASPGSAVFYEDPAVANAAAEGDDAVLPVAAVRVENESGSARARVVGVAGEPVPVDRRAFRPGNGTTLGTLDGPENDDWSVPTGR
jgi:hypothetical protein